MNNYPSTQYTQSERFTAVLMLVGLIGIGSAIAQDASEPPASTPATVPAPAISTMIPSRMVNPEEIEPYLQFVYSRIDIAGRATDPFGQLQDTTQKVEIKKPTLKTRRPTRMKATTFDEIIGRIRVTTVMPAENRFLIGGRSFRLGDEFPIAFRGRSYDVKVVGVDSKKIEFKKVDTGETSSVKLNMLPPGMEPGSNGISAPGLLSNDQDAPLQVDGTPVIPGS